MLERPQTASTALVPNDNTLVTTETITPHKVVLFDTNVDSKDVEKTLNELVRLQAAGYQVYGYSKTPETLIESNLDKSDSTTVLNPNEHSNLQKWHNIPMAIVQVDEYSSGLIKDFCDIFEAVVKTVPDLRKWIALEGFVVGNQERLGNRFKLGSHHVIPFSSRLSRIHMTSASSTSKVGKEIAGGGITLLYEKKGEMTVGNVMFAVDIKYHGQQCKSLSTALNQIDTTFTSRIGMSLFTFKSLASPATLALNADEQLLLKSSADVASDELVVNEELQQPVQTTSRRFIFLAFMATAITAITALTSFLLAPVVLASIITTAIAVTFFIAAGIAEYFLRKNDTKQSQAVIEEFDEDDDEYTDANETESQAVLKKLRIVRHNDADEEAKEEDDSLDVSGPGTTQVELAVGEPSVLRRPSI